MLQNEHPFIVTYPVCDVSIEEKQTRKSADSYLYSQHLRGGAGVQGQPLVCTKFKANLVYKRPCYQTKTEKTRVCDKCEHEDKESPDGWMEPIKVCGI